jgi:carboxy-terminal domain RNA polymerase II polypeptide A small phosphatase
MSFFDHFILLCISAVISYHVAKYFPWIPSFVMSIIHVAFDTCIIYIAIPISAINADHTILGIEWTDFAKLSHLLQYDKGVSIRKYLVRIMSDLDTDAQDMFRTFSYRTDGPTLVLDLDETLVHSTSIGDEKSIPYDFMLLDDDRRIYTPVYKRPFVELFLDMAAQYFEVVLYTASYECYCEPIMSMFSNHRIIKKRLYNTSILNGEKDLNLTTESNMPCRTIMVDNSPQACVVHHENLYVIKSFYGENPDFELISLLLFLISVADVNDFRAILYRRDKYNHHQVGRSIH